MINRLQRPLLAERGLLIQRFAKNLAAAILSILLKNSDDIKV